MKKGVDVVLDPTYGSIAKKFSLVKGDRRKLKQILCNLLSNAVKFTSEGHVTVRAWARKWSFENEILASNHNNWTSGISCLLFQFDKSRGGSRTVNAIQNDPNCVECIFEVNDTGKGIPKERQKSVFEKYVQVKETALGQEGTGLGLGIVQSLVRLMGGEITIVDKDVGERGICFRFNAFFSNNPQEDDINIHGGSASIDSYQFSGTINRIHSPKAETSKVVIFIQSNERSKILQKFMTRLGLKAYAVEHHEQLSKILKRIKQKLNLSRQSSSGKSDIYSSRASSTPSKDVPLSSLDGTDNIPYPPLQRRTSGRNLSSFILIVIDKEAGPFRDVSRAVAEFRRDLTSNCCSRVVWLDRTGRKGINFHGLDEDKLPAVDLIVSKPLHGSRLKRIIRLLPEYGGTIQGVQLQTVKLAGENLPLQMGEGTSNEKPLTGKKMLVVDDDPIGRKIATSFASRLGAKTFSCVNGEEALEAVCKGLKEEKR